MVLLDLVISTQDGDVFPVQVDGGEPFDKLKEIVEMVTGIAPAQQALLVNGNILSAAASIQAAHLKHGDLLLAVRRDMVQGSGTQRSADHANAMRLLPDGTAADPRALLDALAANENAMDAMRASGNPMLDIVTSRDVAALQSHLRQVSATRDQAPADPLDPEYQARMYEEIQRANIQDNLEAALEHHPEAFGEVDMLYVDVAVNGEPLQAFIDSGAQMTIMSQACAEKCGIMRLVDRRFKGTAVGVGSAEIIGRIHAVALRVADQHITTSVTILAQRDDPQFIFGLDNLRRHQCSINLKRHVLEVGSCAVELPFLATHQLPASAHRLRRLQSRQESDGAVPSDAAQRPSAPSSGTERAAAQHEAPGPDASEVERKVAQLQEITGASAAECAAALTRCNGNLDAAAGDILG